MNTEALKQSLNDLHFVESIIEKNLSNNSFSTLERDLVLSKLRDVYELLTKSNENTGEPAIINKPVESVKPVVEKIEKEVTVQKEVIDDPIIHIQETEPQTTIKAETIADKYHSNDTFINEYISHNKAKKDFSNVIQSKPIKDIESAIEINDKFQFIRELFSGDTETYNKTINILNNSANFNDAFNYINQHYSWNLEGDAAHKLLEIVRRRFITLETDTNL